MCWIQISNHFCFWLSGRSSNIKQYVFLICEPSFCHCCKVGWELVSGLCKHMNYWKRVFSNCFDVPNPNIKSFLLLVEWKIIKHKTVWFFVMWTIILSFILQFTREIICTALFSILCLIDQTWLFQRLQLQLLMQNAALLLVLENVDLDLTWWLNFKSERHYMFV